MGDADTRKGRGKRLVAVVPVEDRLDAEAAKRAKAEAGQNKEEPIPWTKARRVLGLRSFAYDVRRRGHR